MINQLVRFSVVAGVSTLLGTSTAVAGLTGGGEPSLFVPVQPCRILDTRIAALGSVTANTVYSFSTNDADFSILQGGNAAGCGLPGEANVEASAVAFTITSVNPSGPSYIQIFPYNEFGVYPADLPNASVLNFSAGAVVGNSSVVKQNATSFEDLELSIYSTVNLDVVIDVVGYYTPYVPAVR